MAAKAWMNLPTSCETSLDSSRKYLMGDQRLHIVYRVAAEQS